MNKKISRSKEVFQTDTRNPNHQAQLIKRAAIEALRKGDFDFALQAIERGEASIPEMVEDLKIYQTELEMQNEELRQSQQITDEAIRRFCDLFDQLPLSALVVDELWIVHKCNHFAEQQFKLRLTHLHSHFFPRLVKNAHHNKLHRLMEATKVKGQSTIFTVSMETGDISPFTADIHMSLLPDSHNTARQFVITLVDQTQNIAQKEALEASRRHFMAYFDSSPLGMAAIGVDKTWLEVNERLCRLLGYSPKELKTMTWQEITHPDDIEAELALFNQMLACKIADYDIDKRFIDKAGGIFDAHIAAYSLCNRAGDIEYIVITVENIATRKRTEYESQLTAKRNAALLALTTQAPTMTENGLLVFALEHAETLTCSEIAYAHFVNDNQENIRFGAWSTNTLKSHEIVHEPYYPISKAGILASCFHQKETVIHDDYRAVSHKRGLIEDHVDLQRHMGVPVMDGEKVVMIFGVGNKTSPYSKDDLMVLEMIANNTWVLLQRNRGQHLLELHAEVFRSSREGGILANTKGEILSVNEAFTTITGYSAQEVIGKTPHLLRSGKHSNSFYQSMWAKILAEGHWQGEIFNRRKNGEIYPQWLGISKVQDDQGYIAVFMDISEYKQAQERIEFMAGHDPLTGLGNRSLLADRFQHAEAYAHRTNTLLSLLFLDLDHFKNVNDSLGHSIGDQLLLQVACRLLGCVRASDSVSRFGGDEFIILLNDINTYEDIAIIAQKILDILAKPFEIENNTINVTGSIGICIYPNDGVDFNTLLKKADTALYQAKAHGRNSYQFFTQEMNDRVMRRMKLEYELRMALTLNQFYLHYQPQFDITENCLVGVEALVRWQHPALGSIPPSEFIMVAEENGFIHDLGLYVMRQACLQVCKWLSEGHPVRVAINVSYVQFMRNHFLQSVLNTLQETGLPPQYLELELTESILVANPENVLGVIKELNYLGVSFAIDDFGTGYSSLSYLKRFSVDKLKIDQSFVRDVPDDPDGVTIVTAIINLAHSLNMKCIAEGVETSAQADFLRSKQCDQVQGYLYSKPLSVEQMDSLLAQDVRCTGQ